MGKITDALKKCEVRDSKVILNTELTWSELSWLYEKLRVGIQDGKIPHFKVIGMKYNSALGIAPTDYVSKLKGANQSYVETYVSLQSVVYSGAFGEPYDLGNGHVGWVRLSDNTDIRSDNGSLLWDGTGTCEVDDSLIRDVSILKVDKPDSVLEVMVAEGTGYVDFSEYNYALLKYSFVPVAQYFNLTPYLVLSRLRPEDTALKFTYKENINEEVLTEILRNYAYILEDEE